MILHFSQDDSHHGPIAVVETPGVPSVTVGSPSDPSPCGELRLALMFSPSPSEGKRGDTRGTLHVAVKNARNLPNMDTKGFTDGFVKLYLLPDKSSKGKKKTSVIKDNLNPEWEEKFAYEKVSFEDLQTSRVLEVTVWDYDKGSSNDFVGGLRLGPSPDHATRHKEWIDSNRDEADHWEEMLTRRGEWVERWHSLRASMDPRTIDISDISALAVTRKEEKEEVPSQGTPADSGADWGAGSEGISLLASADVVKSELSQDFRKVTVKAAQQHQERPQEQQHEQQQTSEPQEPVVKVNVNNLSMT